MTTGLTGPLAEIRVLEFASLAPAPFACTLLSDLGADVLRITNPADRGLTAEPHPGDPLDRGRSVAALDLKRPRDVETALELAAGADVLVEGFRPGVMERLGLGPDDCLKRNPRLVYARMTGWGQDGPLAARAGHDINYAAIAGALGTVGEPGRKPVPPLNLIADFGGGALYLVTGILAALVERAGSGQGQVLDVAMVDGTTSLLAMALGFYSAGIQQPKRGSNLLDGGAPFYDTYRCADGEYIAVGALEPQFFAELVRVLGVTDDVPDQNDLARWPQMRELFASVIAGRSRDEWAAAFDGVDACVTPVLRLDEVESHPHIAARRSVVRRDGVLQPNVAPRLSRTPGQIGDVPGSQVVTAAEAVAAWSA